ncbi:Hypothetical protein, putative [Bodo saltans]|uniref:Membrane-associated protein n=1 Tax=Bodo saltans TaxID=75058 RepID=A0A0S4KJD8_BODSA|nr:Hypothetical protein, putative [Bodo saltans]|eukprot:CUI15096.1 Hypothetical protein, putative [Bodo saltans]
MFELFVAPMQMQPSTTRCRQISVVSSLFVCSALVALSVLPEAADAYIRDSDVTDYAPNQVSYLAYISVWYMNSAQQVDGMRVWFLPPAIWGSTTYTGDLLATDYAGGIPITQSYDQNKKTLIVSGSGSVRQYNAVLMSVYFNTTNYYQAWRYFYWNLGASYYFWRWSTRWYTWRVPANSTAFLWDDAVADCQSLTYLGMTGYLATGESHWPNWFIYYYSYGVRSWLGAGDDTVPGMWWWRWIQGPYYSNFSSSGQGLPFYGQTCVTQPVGSYYPPWFFPAWYQDMFPNIGNVPPSWAAFMKACLKRFGSAQWCPDTPIQQMTTCSTGCIAGGYCNFATGYPTSQPPAIATSSPYANPSWQRKLPPNAKGVLPASWTVPQYNNTGRHRLMMQTKRPATGLVACGRTFRAFLCATTTCVPSTPLPALAPAYRIARPTTASGTPSSLRVPVRWEPA